jgi:hypothetical protein
MVITNTRSPKSMVCRIYCMSAEINSVEILPSQEIKSQLSSVELEKSMKYCENINGILNFLPKIETTSTFRPCLV